MTNGISLKAIREHEFYHPSWEVLDSTKLNAMLTCPKRAAFEYVVGWKEPYTLALDFGIAVHKFLEMYELTEVMQPDIPQREKAMTAIVHGFIPKFELLYNDMNAPELGVKNLTRMMAMAGDYAEEYADDHYKLVEYPESKSGYAIEVGGMYTIKEDFIDGESLKLSFRLDALKEDTNDGLIYAFEHKSGMDWYTWESQWTNSIQCGTYYAILDNFLKEKCGGVIVNGLLLTKNKGTRGGKMHNFRRALVRKSRNEIETWRSTVLDLAYQYYYNLTLLCTNSNINSNNGFNLINGQNCHKFNKLCPYASFCADYSIGESFFLEPLDFVTGSFWDPATEECNVNLNI